MDEGGAGDDDEEDVDEDEDDRGGGRSSNAERSKLRDEPRPTVALFGRRFLPALGAAFLPRTLPPAPPRCAGNS